MKKIWAWIVAIGSFVLWILTLGHFKNKKDKEEALENVDKVGENIEAKKHDADSALDFYDDFFSDSNGRE